jgi:hypothetical protein
MHAHKMDITPGDWYLYVRLRNRNSNLMNMYPTFTHMTQNFAVYRVARILENRGWNFEEVYIK